MNSEPCVRFGIRISPKMREKPADSRNNKPPKVMLLAVSTSQKVMVAVVPANVSRAGGRLQRRPLCCRQLRFERRIIARIDGLFEKLLLVVGPELAHIAVNLDRLVDEFAVRLFEMADVEVADHV